MSRLAGPDYFAMKTRITRRDGPTCHYCGRRIGTKRYCSTLDHVWPVSLGGVNRAWNFVLACRDCNSARGSDVAWCDCPEVCAPAVLLGARHAGEMARSPDLLTRGPSVQIVEIAQEPGYATAPR